jgi:hypothetical protein
MEQFRRRRIEQHRPELPRTVPVGADPASESAGPGASSTVRVVWGLMTENLDVQNMTVEEVHGLLRGPFHIAPGVRALVNGRVADGEQRLCANDVLEFVRPAGEKGARK